MKLICSISSNCTDVDDKIRFLYTNWYSWRSSSYMGWL